MRAYDLWFAADRGIATHPEGTPVRPAPAAQPDGWIGSAGPGIEQRSWPRGPLTGLPMFHLLTLRLPPAYRRRGAAQTAIAFFQGEGQSARPRPGAQPPTRLRRLLARTDLFAQAVRCATDHPRLERRTDLIGGQFALLRLTEEEFAANPSVPPPDPRRPGQHVANDDGPNAWDTRAPTRPVWLVERPDPNAGLAPADPFGATPPGYVTPCTDQGDRLPWAQDLAPCHLGGTAFPEQDLPDGLTPFYLELAELPGANFGGGVAQLDLDSDVFDWSCD